VYSYQYFIKEILHCPVQTKVDILYYIVFNNLASLTLLFVSVKHVQSNTVALVSSIRDVVFAVASGSSR
jgi:hypothetical protein